MIPTAITGLTEESVNCMKSKKVILICCLQFPWCAENVATYAIQHMGRAWIWWKKKKKKKKKQLAVFEGTLYKTNR